MDAIINHHGWRNLFDVVAVSAEVGSTKKYSEIFLHALQELSMRPEECVFIDNDEENLVAPRELGLTVMFFDHEMNDVDGVRVRKGLRKVDVV